MTIKNIKFLHQYTMENQNTIIIQQILWQILPFVEDFFIKTYGKNSWQYKSLLELENKQQPDEETLKKWLEILSRFQMIDFVEYILKHKKEYAKWFIKLLNIAWEIIPARSIRKEFEKAISESEATIDTHKNLNISIMWIIISVAWISLSNNYRLSMSIVWIILRLSYSLTTNRFKIQKHKYYISFMEHLQDILNNWDTEALKNIFEIIRNTAPKQEQQIKIKADILIKYAQWNKKVMYWDLICENKYPIMLVIIYIIWVIIYKHYFI